MRIAPTAWRAGCDAGLDVALLCEGDPFFYGSSMYLLDRLGGAIAARWFPGVTGMSGCWTQARTPIRPWRRRADCAARHAGRGPAGHAARRLRRRGHHEGGPQPAEDPGGFGPRGRSLGRAIYVERGTMSGERIVPLAEMDGQTGAVFRAGAGARPAAARDDRPAHHRRPWTRRRRACRRRRPPPHSPPRPTWSATRRIWRGCRSAPARQRHASDNREELDRARHRAVAGRRAGAGWPWCRPAMPACSPWRARCSRRSTEASPPGARWTSRWYQGSRRCSPPPRVSALRWGTISAPSRCRTTSSPGTRWYAG